MDTETFFDEVEALAEERFYTPSIPRGLWVVFDPSCALCRRCRDWMLEQASLVPLRFVPCTADECQARFGDIPWVGDELVVVADTGDVWAGPAAFLTCLWALEHWREWSFRLAGPAFAPLAERFFHSISSNRKGLSALLSHRCEDGACSLPRSHAARPAARPLARAQLAVAARGAAQDSLPQQPRGGHW